MQKGWRVPRVRVPSLLRLAWPGLGWRHPPSRAPTDIRVSLEVLTGGFEHFLTGHIGQKDTHVTPLRSLNMHSFLLSYLKKMKVVTRCIIPYESPAGGFSVPPGCLWACSAGKQGRCLPASPGIQTQTSAGAPRTCVFQGCPGDSDVTPGVGVGWGGAGIQSAQGCWPS